MPRMTRDSRLETRDARSKLKVQHGPYWRTVQRGLALGYRRNKAKKAGAWYARVRNKARDSYDWRSLGNADDFADADGNLVLSYPQALKAAQEAASAPGRPYRGQSVYTVADAMRDYLEEKANPDTAYKVNAYILPVLGERPVSDLTADELRRWLHSVAVRPARGRKLPEDADEATRAEYVRRRRATANRLFTILRAALNYAFMEGKVSSNREWKRVGPFRKVEGARTRFLSPEESRRLLNGCAPDFRELVHGGMVTGARYGELTRMRVSDYSAEPGKVHIREGKTARSRRWIPLTAEGVALFERLTVGKRGSELIFTKADGSPWKAADQVRPMRAANLSAGIEPPVSFHVLRHSYASALVQAGVPLAVVAVALGHVDTRMCEAHYAHLRPSDIDAAIRANLPAIVAGKKSKVAALRRAQK